MVHCLTSLVLSSLQTLMELLRFGVLALLCLAVAGSDAPSSRSAEKYWRSIWPEASLPKNLEYLLGSGVKDAEKEDTEYPYNSFFEDDLHAGKQMNIVFNTPYTNEEQKSNAIDKDPEKSSSSHQPWGVGSWKRKKMDEDLEKPVSPHQPWGVGSWKRNTMNEDSEKSVSHHQPWGVGSWKRNIVNEDSEKSVSYHYQPWGVGSWKRNPMNEDSEKPVSPYQPWGVSSWKRNTVNEDSEKPVSSQPWGVGSWKRNTMNEDSKSISSQPWGVGSWKRNAVDVEKSSSTQPWGVGSWKRNAMDQDVDKSSSNQPWGVGSWKRNTMRNDPEYLSLEAICSAKEKFVGEDDKFCAKSIESLLDFVISKLGKDIEALTSSFVPHQTQYKILEGVQRISSEGVMCHKLNFDEPVFYCHQVNATITYIVPMEAADGTRTSIVALCHSDTRGLDPHKLFHQLRVKPGTVPVCHFLGSGAITWVPRNSELKAGY